VTFLHNSDLYADPTLAEGRDYARRYRRHERFDDTVARTDDVPKTTILAPHGGGIEPGTSELCLAVAGYHPANLVPVGVTYDYWMFEGLWEDDNTALHVTSTGCDDGVAVSLCAGSLNALALHGKNGQQEDVLVGGGNDTLRQYLGNGLDDAGFVVIDAGGNPDLDGPDLDGNNPCNIVNRTLRARPQPSTGPLGMGAQLELSNGLRRAMFTKFTRSGRKLTTTQLFWTFVAVCRDALDRLQAEQVGLTPFFRSES
jgi:phage replication-related protein YjqB (UPF0714/DUF867 family)